jgi:predicted CopG family antitoxin
MVGDTSIRVSRDAKARLDLHKRDDESYDDVILRLASRDKWAGFGVAGGDPEAAREGMADLRDSMRESMARDIERSDEDETDERGNA